MERRSIIRDDCDIELLAIGPDDSITELILLRSIRWPVEDWLAGRITTEQLRETVGAAD